MKNQNKVTPASTKPAKEFQQLKDKTFIINHTISGEQVAHEYQHVLSHAAEHVNVKGFRPGKAPLDVVEGQVDSTKILEQVAQNLISDIYTAKIKEHDLKPIIQPQIKVLNPPISKDSDWQVEITGCELPEIELGNLEDKVKKLNTAAPKTKAKKDEVKSEKSETDQKMDAIFDAILDTAKVNLPDILVDADVQSRLSQLVDQVNQAGITVADYLKNKNTTVEKYQDDVKKQVTKEWILNLAIDKVATDHNIEVDQKEVEALVSKNPQAATNVNMLMYVMRQQKVLEYLQSLK